MILSRQTIFKLVADKKLGILPFCPTGQIEGLSFGLSCCGYDIRIAQDVILYPNNILNMMLNRKSFVLASSFEKFSIPADLAAVVMDKSTWARQGLALQNTILEPGWSGYITLELSNHGNKTLRIKEGCPIAQIVFHKLDEETNIPYHGKYSNQEAGPQEARFT